MKELQMDAFVRQLSVAKKYDLPVNVHSRYAGHYCVDMLIQQGVTKVLLHAYDGNLKSVKKALAAGYYFSIPASIQNDESFQRLAKNVPLSNMLIETDSPALSIDKDTYSFASVSSLAMCLPLAMQSVRFRNSAIVRV